ncbi:MAG: alkene reductase [Chloracidobacterium sp.]|nr:alkene reductase [Chloracidobacterium sp.]
MTKFFDELMIGDLKLKNRIVMAPMTRSRANDDGIQPDYVPEYYAQRASGGLLISEATNISPMAKGYVRTPGIYTPEQIDAWKQVTAAVHANGGRIFMQIFHTGRIALPELLPDNAQPVAPSAVKAAGQNYTDSGMKDFVEPRELTTEEVKETVRDFAAAATNAIEAGFDGVELHSASGYLVHQFLMQPVNQRTDEYGGSVKNRTRFVFEILDAMSDAIGKERVGVKFSPQMPYNDIQEPDADEVYPFIMSELSKKDLAYVHVAAQSDAGWHDRLRPLYSGVYIAGGNFDRDRGAEYLGAGKADAIAFGVKFLANPDLPARFEQNAELNQPDQSTFYAGGEKGYTDYPTLAKAAGSI